MYASDRHCDLRSGNAPTRTASRIRLLLSTIERLQRKIVGTMHGGCDRPSEYRYGASVASRYRRIRKREVTVGMLAEELPIAEPADDADELHGGVTKTVFDRVYAPSTIGSSVAQLPFRASASCAVRTSGHTAPASSI